jgi:hypothetical protein
MIANGKIGTCNRNKGKTTSKQQFQSRAHLADLAANGGIKLNWILQKMDRENVAKLLKRILV